MTVAGASVALVGMLGLAGSLGGLGAMILGAFLTAPYADRPGAPAGGWWRGLVIGTIVALAGQALALASPPLGGLLLGAGCIAAIVAAALGPRSSE